MESRFVAAPNVKFFNKIRQKRSFVIGLIALESVGQIHEGKPMVRGELIATTATSSECAVR